MKPSNDLLIAYKGMVKRDARERFVRVLVEDSVNLVWLFAGLAVYGPHWLGGVGCAIWFARILALRSIWKREDAHG